MRRGDRLSKVALHPDREEIVRRLTDGESVKEIERWLAKKYSRSSRAKNLKISFPTLQAFRKEILKIDANVIKDINEAKRIKEEEIESEIIKHAVTSTNAYKDKISKIADKHLDVATKIIQLDAIIGDRIENWYNLIKSGEGIPDKADYELRKYIDQQMVIMRDWKKLVEGLADKRVDYNVNITVMNEQIQEIQSTIRELICEEMGIEHAISFMDKLSQRISGRSNKQLSGNILDVVSE